MKKQIYLGLPKFEGAVIEDNLFFCLNLTNEKN